MENKKKLSTGAIIALIIVAALNIVWLVCVCYLGIIKGGISFNTSLSFLMFAAAAVYALFAYKKPHGNYMRYLLLAYTLIGSVMFVQLCKNQELYMNIIDVVMIILMAYMAGRLDHYKQNIVICGIVLAKTILVSALLISKMSSLGRLDFVTFFGCIGSVTCWLAVAASYLVRYKPHKEAGLADKN